MAVIRLTEKAAHDLFLQGLVKGTSHLAAGHEAVAVGDQRGPAAHATTCSRPTGGTITRWPAARHLRSAWPS